jgi:peptide/nickel transport system ATP-binding protein
MRQVDRGLAVMRDLGVNGRIVGGSIRFKGRDLTNMGNAELRKLRGSEIAMIYQEPMASLNPAMKIGRQLMEVPTIHQDMPAKEARELSRQLVADVRLPDPDRILDSYPHQLSADNNSASSLRWR